ncbi:bifunctional adhesin/ABC transporter aspartate /glutamate-binding protein [Helicobacter mustelae]|nr:bifunctional adhesin/ABC transporter aspartate /glutamate-binding protein [Helicobacter mustelae]
MLKNKNINSFKDLDNKTIGVAQGATTQKVLESAAKEAGIKIKVDNYPDYPSLKAALVAGRIDAFSVDKSILLGYVDKDSKILKDNFAKQSYDIATSKKGS